MSHKIAYGSKEVIFDLPPFAAVDEYRPNQVFPAQDAAKEIRNALEHPFGESLESLIRPGSRVCIIVDDITRPTPSAIILDELIPRIQNARAQAIFFIFALGSHRRMTEDEIHSKLGRWAEVYPVFQSNFSNQRELAVVGEADGVPIEISRCVMESDIRIGIGNIVPHNTLGWSGGGKILFPGIASENTVSRFHVSAMRKSTERIFGNADNSIRKKIEVWAELIGLHFIVNTILTDHGKLYRAVAGNAVQAHRAGVALARDVYAVSAKKSYDLVIVNSHPSDCDFWQGTKGLNPADLLVRDGGAVILVSPFHEGVGPHPEYPMMIGNDHADDLLEAFLRGSAGQAGGCDPLAVSVGALISRMRQRFRIYVYSEGVSDRILKEAGMKRSRSISETAQEICRAYKKSPRICIVHNGAEIVPVAKEEYAEGQA